MQFVNNGPNIPEKLLQAHEEGKVVFFCGAGISFPAKLPGFGGLVRSLYENLGVVPSPIQEQTLKLEQFDTAVSLLEATRPSSEWRNAVRKELVNQLKPDYSDANATTTHKALLQLATTKDKRVRLITTNFDRIFQDVSLSEKIDFPIFQAPLLPVPKSRWSGLVYLHGLIPENISDFDLDNLVISSGDFGLAYLNERWASRFVSELFRTYVVCFVGYSLNDPVLRYMMDALAADRLLGESPPEMFAFGNYKTGKNEEKEYEHEKQNWLAKNVTPILYKNHRHHYYLHKTLEKWSETYRDGLVGKQQIVVTTAFTKPSEADLGNGYAYRLAWALSDPTGIPAKTFAQLTPPPPIEWLNVLNEIKLDKSDLPRFGIVDTSFKENFEFRLFSRPPKSAFSPNMSLASFSHDEVQWDKVMNFLGIWLVKHLDKPELVLFLCKQGGRLHSDLHWKINNELRAHRKNSGDILCANLGEEMLTIWELILSGYCTNSSHRFSLYSWVDKYKVSYLSLPLKHELKTLLSPKIRFSEPLSLASSESGIKRIFRSEVVLTSSHPYSAFKELNKVDKWSHDIGNLFIEFNLILLEIMELRSLLGEVNEYYDYSYIHQPSIAKHPQNKHHNDWTVLIELVRDSWLAMKTINSNAAMNAIMDWWALPFPIFKRLALFALAELPQNFSVDVNELLEIDDSRWLWNTATQREILSLLPKLFLNLSDVDKNRLVCNILKGPSKSWFRKELTEQEFKDIKDRAIWLRLSKLKRSSLNVGIEGDRAYEKMLQKHPMWGKHIKEEQEFPFWMSTGFHKGLENNTPLELNSLITWLEDNPEVGFRNEDDWSIRCRKEPKFVIEALIQCNSWLPERWNEAINIWSENRRLSYIAWDSSCNYLLSLEKEKLVDISRSLAFWLDKNFDCKVITKSKFFTFYDLLITLPFEKEIDINRDPLMAAINHPVGILTELLFKQWYREKPKDGYGISSDYKERLNHLCNQDNEIYILSKAIISTNVLSLYSVSPEWAEEHILNWFNWSDCSFSQVAWFCYLWSPRLHKEFLIKIKVNLLETASHLDDLGEQSQQYAKFLTYVALQKYDEYGVKEVAVAFSQLSGNAFYHVTVALNDALTSSGDKFDEYWENRIKPFLLKVWPKNQNFNELTINQLAILCLNTQKYFVESYSILQHSLSNINDFNYLLRKLNETSLSEKYPETVLKFLNQIIEDEPRIIMGDLNAILARISSVDPLLIDTQKFSRLNALGMLTG